MRRSGCAEQVWHGFCLGSGHALARVRAITGRSLEGEDDDRTTNPQEEASPRTGPGSPGARSRPRLHPAHRGRASPDARAVQATGAREAAPARGEDRKGGSALSRALGAPPARREPSARPIRGRRRGALEAVDHPCATRCAQGPAAPREGGRAAPPPTPREGQGRGRSGEGGDHHRRDLARGRSGSWGDLPHCEADHPSSGLDAALLALGQGEGASGGGATTVVAWAPSRPASTLSATRSPSSSRSKSRPSFTALRWK